MVNILLAFISVVGGANIWIAPGEYKLNLTIKDASTSRGESREMTLSVPNALLAPAERLQ